MHLQQLSVHGVGFVPGSDLEVAQCTAAATVGDDMMDVCDMTGAVPVLDVVTGEFQTPFEVRSVIGVGGRIEIQCPDATCTVGVANRGTIRALTPIKWSDGVEVPPVPKLTIVSLELEVGDNTGTAVVEGSGYVPGSDVDLVQCPTGDQGQGVAGGDCLYEYGTPHIRVDEQGELRARVAVYPLFQRSSGELINCVKDPEICLISDPSPGDSGNRMSLVSFASAP